jgi:AAA family ATP:ADP antiporter
LLKALFRRLFGVEDREIPAMLWAFAQMFCLLMGNYVLRAVRESLGSTRGSIDYNWLYTGTFVAMLGATTTWAALVGRFPVRRFLTFAHELFAASFLLFWVVFALIPDPGRQLWVSYAFFVWYSVYNLFVVSMFWSHAADVFTHDQGKRVFAFVAAGGSLGAIAGSAFTQTLAVVLGTLPMLLVPVVLLQAVVFCSRRLSATAPPRAAAAARAEDVADRPSPWSSFQGLLRSPYLLLIATYVVFSTFCGTFVYTMQGDVASTAFADRNARTQYYAGVDFRVNVLSFLTSLLIARRVISWIGVGAALFLLPAVYVFGFSFAWASPVLSTVVVLEVARRVAGYGITTPAREVLFTVVSRADKYKAKNAIDTFVWRGGDVAAVWLMELAFRLGPGERAPAATKVGFVAAIGIPVAIAWLVAAAVLRRAHRRVVAAGTPATTVP